MFQGIFDQFAAAGSGMIDAAQEADRALGCLFQMPRTADEMALIEPGKFSPHVDHLTALELAAYILVAVESNYLVPDRLILKCRHGVFCF